ncbi:TfoX/Sxy family protein [Hymenobacter sp. APR13]|uniref:TfoX/Sxy family protein n=1 Tax=Hymenobacter sp. APR13 TaxID=1356852 RepID=UPI0004E05C14|nr:TfoX/Sxy family protein [Hymenobacter sp. APR13]AII54360.1 hypothetical protein N008_20530 [Hymenobacter sp. APR13]
MSATDDLLPPLYDALQTAGVVEAQSMFRGTTLMLNGKMCVSIGPEDVMFRFDPQQHEQAMQRPGARPMQQRGREYRGYAFVEAATLRLPQELAYWLGLALAFNPQARPARRRT